MTDPKEPAPTWAKAVVEAFRPPLVWDERLLAFVPGHIWDERDMTPYQRFLEDAAEWDE